MSLICTQLATGTSTAEDPVSLLYGHAPWFNNKKDIYFAKRVIAKADELLMSGLPIRDLHFYYTTMIQIYCKSRDDPVSFARAVWACKRLIEIPPQAVLEFKREYRELKASAIRDAHDSNLPARCKPPRNIGIQLLCVIVEKGRDFKCTLQLAKRACRDGWDGDWDRRIPKLDKRVASAKKLPKRRQT